MAQVMGHPAEGTERMIEVRGRKEERARFAGIVFLAFSAVLLIASLRVGINVYDFYVTHSTAVNAYLQWINIHMYRTPLPLRLRNVSAQSDRLVNILFFSLLGMVFCIAFFTISVRIKRKSRRMRLRAIKGANAEKKIGGLLNSLPDTFTVLHDIPFRYGNIDHIVIGKSKVFIVETKSHCGRISYSSRSNAFLLDGHRFEKDFVRQVMTQLRWIKPIVESFVGRTDYIYCVIAFANANPSGVGNDMVRALSGNGLLEYIKSNDHGSRITKAERESICSAFGF